MRLKVYDDPSKHLCRTCRHGRVAEGSTKTASHCIWGMGDGQGEPINFIVNNCTMYDNKLTPTKYDFEKLAWVIQTDKSGEVVGFKAPKKGD